MKFKFLFLGMLAAAAMVGCNNDVIEPIGSGSDEEGPIEETYATFLLKSGTSAVTYAGDDEVAGTGNENLVQNAVMAIYKQTTGAPEALAYITAAPEGTTPSTGTGGKFTLKCYTGAKIIYLALNIGTPVASAPSAPASNILVFGNTAQTVENTSVNPGITELYTGVPGTLFKDSLNALIVSSGAATYYNDWGPNNPALATSGSPTYPNGAFTAKADGVILGLTGNGNTANGALTDIPSGTGPNTPGYLMSNWDGDNDVTNHTPIQTNTSSARFTLKKVTAAVSRGGTAPDVNKNAFNIYVQRAIAKISLNVKETAAVSGSGTNQGVVDLNVGTYTPAITTPKFAVGNINKAEYPFQQFDGTTVKSAAYDLKDGIATGSYLTTPSQWLRFMDNTRLYGTTHSLSEYPATYKFDDSTTIAAIQGTPNIAYLQATSPSPTSANYVNVTENNSSEALNAYTTFVVFAAQYKPAEIVIAAPVGSTDATVTKLPTNTQPDWRGGTLYDGTLGVPLGTNPQTNALWDTLYYVKDAGYAQLADGKFFWGANTLKNYAMNVLGLTATAYEAKVDPTNTSSWAYATDVIQPKLQKYYKGQCFYRVWIKDQYISAGGTASEGVVAEKFLVRRNHIYNINVTHFEGPGIGDPNTIIDPDPTTGPEPLEETETYVTATITVLPWHKVTQTVSDAGLGN